ncbi:metallophosphoesterase [Chitinophaga vietnamensis]|uniref:metallophosphoesterase n=1 Tax=Chitinophaga vietnamensis TaxID=2593957 RepID=UPI001177C204|nr:metallophosphoesterase [Chitinophaga vietnamensis]
MNIRTATWVIGDIHGGLKALQQVIERIGPESMDRLIFLGDFVDGWSESAAVIRYLMELDQQYACIFIKGNHDAWCESWLDGTMPGDVEAHWLLQGGLATVQSYLQLSPEEKLLHLSFFQRMKDYYEEEERLFIHAGFTSLHGPAHDRFVGTHRWDRTLWEMALAMDPRIQKDSRLYPRRLLLYKEIFIGHTITLKFGSTLPMQACNVFNVDTGAAYDGKLSAMNIDTKAVVQSDPLPLLYPNEKGRNA